MLAFHIRETVSKVLLIIFVDGIGIQDVMRGIIIIITAMTTTNYTSVMQFLVSLPE